MKNLFTYFFLFSAFFCAPFFVIGQSNSSFSQQIHQPEKTNIQTEIDSAKILFNSDPILAMDKVEAAILSAIENGYRYEVAQGYSALAGFYIELDEYESSILYSERALTIYETFDNWKNIYDEFLRIGKNHITLNQLKKAKKNIEKAIAISIKSKNVFAELIAKFELGRIQILEKNYINAEKLYLEIKEKAIENKYSKLVGEIEYMLAKINEYTGNPEKAIDFYDLANNTAYQTNNTDLINRSNNGLATNYQIAQSDSSKNLFNSLNTANVYFQENKDTFSLITNSVQIADYMVQAGDYNGAAKQLTYSLDISGQYGSMESQVNTNKKLHDVYLQSNNSSAAVEAYQNYIQLRDSLVAINLVKTNTTLQEKIAMGNVEKQINVLERERKLDQQTIQLLEKERKLNDESIRQQSRLLYVFGFVLLLFLAASVYVYRNNKAKKRAHQLLYLKSLRAQMNPHFIFNSLNSVNNYISKSNERAANKYLSKFSKSMRQVLEYSQVEFISLTNEIEVLQLYVELEHERFKNKFAFKFEVDDSINTDSYTIPPMLVQPFIENAIWHGLRYKETAGILEIQFINQQDFVEIIVKDNGIGRKKSQELKTINQKKHNSTGMKNVENRTEMIKAVFKTKIDYEIIDLPNNGGTTVIIKLYHHE